MPEESQEPDPSSSAQPVLADREAISRVRHGVGRRLAESVDTTGKAVGLLAGLGFFFVGAGYFVEWQRLRQGKLPPEEVLPLIPKDQVAAAGVRELVISLLFVGITLAFFGFVLTRIARWAQGRPGRIPRGLNRVFAKDVAFPTAIVGVVTLLIVPFDSFGVLITVILTGLFFYGLHLIHRFLETGDHSRFPLWRLALAVGLAAVVLAGARQVEFPERRPDIVVCLTNGDVFEGDYIASDGDKILIRKRVKAPFKRKDRLMCADSNREEPQWEGDNRQGERPRLIVVPNEEVREIQIAKSPKPRPYKRSLLDRIFSHTPVLPEIELSCIPPECRWGGDVRIGPSSYL